MRGIRYIAGLMIFVFLLPANLINAAGKAKKTVVVVPIHNANWDNETDQAAQTISDLLGGNSGLRVIEKKKVDSVLHYYDRSDISKDDNNVQRLLDKAKDSYYRLNYIEAKSLVNKAISTLKSSPRSVYDNGKSLLDAHLILGIISRSMGNIGEARQAFREALRLDPDYRLDSRAFPPSMVNVFESVRGSLQTQPKGSIRVQTNPKMAEVYVNGVIKGVTPLTVDGLPEGAHYIKVSANKYNVVRKEINVRGGSTVKIKETLKWLGGKRGKMTGKNFVSTPLGLEQVDEALKIADLMRVDKVILIDVDGEAGSGVVTARMIDSKYRAGHRPFSLPFSESAGIGTTLASLSKQLISETYVSLADNPEKYVDPPGSGDPSLMGAKKQRKISKPVLFGILGGVLAVGLGAGLAAAFAGGGGGGGGNGDGTGSVSVMFK